MKEAEWAHEKELKTIADLSKNPTKKMEAIHLRAQSLMRKDENLKLEDAFILAADYYEDYAPSATQGFIDVAHSEGTRLAIANGITTGTTRVYDKLGVDIAGNMEIQTKNMILIPKKNIRKKIIVDGKKKKVDEEIINFEGFKIEPNMFYFDDKTGTIYQYTGTTPIQSWSDLQLLTEEGQWRVYIDAAGN